MLSQGEQHRSLMGDDDDDEDQGNLERDLDKALAASTVKYQDSDEVTSFSKRNLLTS